MNEPQLDEADLLRELIKFCETQFGVFPVSSDTALDELGLDSMERLRVFAFVSKKLNVLLADALLTSQQSLATLLNGAIAIKQSADATEAKLANRLGTLKTSPSGLIPSIANRHSYLLLRRRNFDSWIICCDPVVLFDRADPQLVSAGAEYLVNRFDALRATITISDSGVLSESISDIFLGEPFSPISCPSHLTADEFSAWLSRAIAEQQAKMGLTRNLFRLVLVTHCPDGRDRLVMLVHHVVADGLSLRLLTNSLFAYLQTEGKPGEHPAPTFHSFVNAYMHIYAGLPSTQIEYWRDQPWHEVRKSQIRLTADDPKNIEQYTSYVERSIRLDIRRLRRISRVTILDRLVVAAGRAYTRVFGGRYCAIAVVNHGRGLYSGVDASNVAGWINDVIPYLIDGIDSTEHALAKTAEHTLTTSGIPSTYTYLRYIRDRLDGLGFHSHPRPQISINFAPGRSLPFNYWELGQADESGIVRTKDVGNTQRVYLLSAGVWATDDCLRLRWDFSTAIFPVLDVARYCDACLEEFEREV